MTDPITNFDAPGGNGGNPSTTKRALRAIRDLRAELASMRGQHNQPVAIVGMGCRFPGAADLDSFWKMLRQKGEGVREVPAERWNPSRYYHPDPKTPGKIAGRWGGFLDGLDLFDATFFGISPREAPHVDPRQRKVLEIAWEALEDAGIPPHSLAGSATGVYIATLSNDYDMMFSRNYRRFTSSTGTGTANSIIANRLSYLLDLHGPSLTLDTACSGSLLAIELACRSLRSGESSLAIAGGVSLNLLPKGDVFFSSAGALSPTGRCRTFDADADGIVRSEGAGVVVLKRVNDAIEDGDRIYAVVRGGAINHDGSSNGIMAPNGEAQKRVLREAYRNAGIAPRTVQYIEAHGTGTPLGDPIEISALADVMAEGRNGTPLVLGSLKSNVGHMEAAAGVAGVIKVALSLHHRVIPPNRHFKQWNPRIPKPPFVTEVRSELGDWPRADLPRIAGVSGFSFGGANAHLVLQEAPAPVPTPDLPAEARDFLLPLSAKSPDALRELAGAYSRFLEDGPALRDVCFTAGARRTHYNCRLAVVGTSAADMAAQLAARSAAPARRVTKLAFVFSGQGSHWKGMGEALRNTEPVFRQTLEDCDLLFGQHNAWSVMEEIRSASRLHETDVSQAAVFSMQVALAALWRSWGIQPAAVAGQSLGEVAAAYVAGALSLESAVAVVHHRSRLMKTLSGKGMTAVVGLAPQAARELIAACHTELHLAGSSGPQTSVVAGPPAAIHALVAAATERGVFGREIAGVDVAFHSPHMEPLRGDLEMSLSRIECAPARTGMMSSVTGEWLNGFAPDGRYWGRNLCEPFQLTSAIGRLIAEGFDGFLEISPSSVLSGAIRQTLAANKAEALVLGSCRRDEPERATMLASLAELYAAGSDVNWSALYPASGRCVSLPLYPWQRERYWIDQLPGGSDASAQSSDHHPLLGQPRESALPGGQRFWEQDIDLTALPYLAGHKVLGATVFPGAAFLECALAAVRQVHGEPGPVEVSGLLFHEPLPLSPDAPRQLQLALSPCADGNFHLQFSARENPAAAWTQHATCTAAPVKAPAEIAALEHFRQSCTEPIDRKVHYEAMAGHGLEYSGDFRAIRQLWRTRGEAFAELELDPGAAAEAGEYGVHPILIDAALQVVAATLDPADDSPYSRQSYLPHGILRACFFASAGERAICTARLVSGKAGDAEIRADVRLADSDGRVCLEIDGLCLRHVGSGAAGARGKLRDWLYDLAWEETPRQSSAAAAPAASWTIFADRQGLGDRLAATLRTRGIGCVLAPAGDHDWERHAAEAGAGVVYLRGLDHPQDPCASLLPLVQALARSGKREIPPLWIVTRQTQAAADRPPVLTAAAQLWGFGRVVALEHPELWGGLVDLDAADADEAEQLADEILAPDAERQVAFRSGSRYAARLRPAAELPKPLPVVFHSDATYLITGGLGGLGLAVARWMTERGARRFILTGRTPLPPRSEWQSLPADHAAKSRVEAVRELERLGASVHPAAFDIADAALTNAFIDAFHAEGWPCIRGVIHAAGVVEDQLMLRLDAATLEKVLRPKVSGALALHEATKHLDLDFFTLFSSVSSVLGQFGQAHYAAGNAFMDHLAHWRRAQGLPATTINWGPWAETGVYARTDAAGKSGRSGVFPMLPNQALQAMEFIQSTAPVQAVVVSADWGRMPASPLLAELAPDSTVTARSAEDEQAAAALLLELLLAEPDERRQRLEEVLRTAAARVLRLDPSRLDIREPLTSFGMDSIMVVELRNYIEKTMNLSISMVDLFTGTVAKLAEQVADKLAAGTQLEELLEQVENMSPQEIQALLGEESAPLN